MTGYIVGYFEEWEFYMNPIVIGYYTTWNEALEAVKIAERINIDQRKGYCRVYLVEIENNKTCFPHFSGKLWIEAYDHYYIYTTNNKTILVSNKGNTIELELPETYNENDTSMPVWEKIKTFHMKNNNENPPKSNPPKSNSKKRSAKPYLQPTTPF